MVDVMESINDVVVATPELEVATTAEPVAQAEAARELDDELNLVNERSVLAIISETTSSRDRKLTAAEHLAIITRIQFGTRIPQTPDASRFIAFHEQYLFGPERARAWHPQTRVA